MEGFPVFEGLSPEEVFQVYIHSKYEGYIKLQEDQIQKFRKMENRKIPDDFDYSQIPNLKREAVEKLSRVRPVNLGQASRIPGISPSAIWNIILYLEKNKKQSERCCG
jgi:tRNA uridine 5-carboxymethylaminomethyl modification enzyme